MATTISHITNSLIRILYQPLCLNCTAYILADNAVGFHPVGQGGETVKVVFPVPSSSTEHLTVP